MRERDFAVIVHSDREGQPAHRRGPAALQPHGQRWGVCGRERLPACRRAAAPRERLVGQQRGCAAEGPCQGQELQGGVREVGRPDGLGNSAAPVSTSTVSTASL